MKCVVVQLNLLFAFGICFGISAISNLNLGYFMILFEAKSLKLRISITFFLNANTISWPILFLNSESLVTWKL